MSTAQSRAKKRADRYYSLIVRHPGVCERCGRTEYLQCAHIVRRTYSSTRTMTDPHLNAWCLCAKCHMETEAWHDEFMALVKDTLGLRAYNTLKRRAQAGVGIKVDWEAEADRLHTIWKDLQ